MCIAVMLNLEMLAREGQYACVVDAYSAILVGITNQDSEGRR